MGITELVVLFLTNNSPLYISMTYERKCQKSRGYIESYPQVNIMKGKTLKGRAWPEGTVEFVTEIGKKTKQPTSKWYRKQPGGPRKLKRT